MGMYWTTVVYFGRLLSKESVSRFRASDVFDSEYLTDYGDDQGRCFLHSPGALVILATMDPILDVKDKTEGITLEELQNATRSSPKLLEPIITAFGDTRIESKLAASAPSDKEVNALPGVYICEFTSDTYGPCTHITYNLKVDASGACDKNEGVSPKSQQVCNK